MFHQINQTDFEIRRAENPELRKVGFVSVRQDLFPTELGEFVVIIKNDQYSFGYYWGTTDKGFCVLMPHVAAEPHSHEIKPNDSFMLRYMKDAPRYVDASGVTISRISREYVKEEIRLNNARFREFVGSGKKESDEESIYF